MQLISVWLPETIAIGTIFFADFETVALFAENYQKRDSFRYLVPHFSLWDDAWCDMPWPS